MRSMECLRVGRDFERLCSRAENPPWWNPSRVLFMRERKREIYSWPAPDLLGAPLCSWGIPCTLLGFQFLLISRGGKVLPAKRCQFPSMHGRDCLKQSSGSELHFCISPPWAEENSLAGCRNGAQSIKRNVFFFPTEVVQLPWQGGFSGRPQRWEGILLAGSSSL